MLRPALLRVGLGLIAATALAFAYAGWRYVNPPAWTPAELAELESLSIAALPPLPPDPTNAVRDDPRAQALGHKLFFDIRLSGNGAIACATCHQPARNFTDGLPLSRAIGTTRRNAPSIVGLAYSPWLYWDGRKDSLWSQALAPLEDANEHGGDRLLYAHLIAADREYRRAYQALFGPLPDLHDAARFPSRAGPLGGPELAAAWQAMAAPDRAAVDRIFSNLGKAIAAYESLLLPGASRFDEYVADLRTGTDRVALTLDELHGLRLFIGEANCTQCHNGPLLTNNAFHNTGVISAPGKLPDKGRIVGVRQARADPFNCLGAYSDDANACDELRFAGTGDELIGAFRTPSLRNLAETSPFAHAGQQPDLRAVLEHYNEAPDAMIGHNEAKPLALWPWQLRQLEAFLGTLAAPLRVDERWLQAPQ